MVVIDEPSFFRELDRLFQSAGKSGSVWFTIKKHTYPKGAHPAAPGQCIVKAGTNKENISTIIDATQVPRFHAAFTRNLNAHMQHSLKKRSARKSSDAGKKRTE
eukprot:TRINITY_DN13904_c0_g1_i1.p1 TRINITY_DN13904_c0_g1~~TRINITY_DN13904_c0_g1_i1.p1  ORF type:complete len:114 (+),score=19.92 TRINITY_DN13904_c0_g1_i1:32-343(+)